MVGIDQTEIDKILAGASADDPGARLDALEKELDFVKTSIKRLLIDLRERMNELDNPFTNAAMYTESRFGQPEATVNDKSEELTSDAEFSIEDSEDREGTQTQPVVDLDEERFPREIADLLPDDMPTISQARSPEKLKLQRIHRLFAWVHRGCNKYGHEHMNVMIDAYLSMGYIAKEVSSQIRDIMRMIPETRRDLQDIGPNEFVSEIYVLNRILDPNDSTLDRDMIEVLMLAHHRPEERGVGGPSSHEHDASDTWVDLLDRI